jgi:hypothetical protein
MGAKEFDAPNWAPLETKGGPDLCAEFMWMWRQAGIEFFKHIRTRRYLLLDSRGRCYRQTADGFELADLDAALERARQE